MQKHVKVENGFQIIQTVYNGKKVVQKRKVKDNKNHHFGVGLRKDKMKNDFGSICFGEEREEEGEEVDPFIKSFCDNSVTTKEDYSSQSVSQQSKVEEKKEFKPKEVKFKKPKNKVRQQQNSDSN